MSSGLVKLAQRIFLLLILLNWRSYPLIWHFRLFKPVLKPVVNRRLLTLTAPFKSRRKALQDVEDYWTDMTPVGKSPFAASCKYTSYCGFDESDWNLHLSNSSYAKVSDYIRFAAGVQLLPQYLRAGGLIPVAATHYHFIREIPMLSSYEIRAELGGWDQKWLYLICKFVTPRKKHNRYGRSQPEKQNLQTPFPELERSTTEIRERVDSSSTISGSSSPAETLVDEPLGNTPSIDSLKAATLDFRAEQEDYILHAVGISRLCFKIQRRISVPPSLVLALNGFTEPSPNTLMPYSAKNPPPHWQRVLELAHPLHGGSVKKLREFLAGGWKEVPSEDRWWEFAFRGQVDVQRIANLKALEAMRSGMDFFGVKG